jgi:RNA polymerase sigma-70 factor, ECF subfamily
MFLRLKSDAPAGKIAWHEFHERYAPMIAEFARRFGVPAHAVDDVSQDVLLAFFSVSPAFEYDPAKGRFRGFLKTCTSHAVLKHLKNSGPSGEVSLTEAHLNSIEVDSAWEDIWEQELLHRAIAQLRAHYSKTRANRKTFRAFEEYVLRERDANEVARELRISRDSVHQAKHRLTHALADEIRQLREING